MKIKFVILLLILQFACVHNYGEIAFLSAGRLRHDGELEVDRSNLLEERECMKYMTLFGFRMRLESGDTHHQLQSTDPEYSDPDINFLIGQMLRNNKFNHALQGIADAELRTEHVNLLLFESYCKILRGYPVHFSTNQTKN